MRLIDADALIHAIRHRTADIIFRGEQTMLTEKDSCNPAEWTRGYEQGVIDTVNMMGSQNIIEVEPVRHGRWVQCFEDWRQQIDGDKCSVCGFEHYGTSIKNYNYCPNCGAKMEKED